MTNEEFIKSVSLEGEEWRIIDDTMDSFAVSSFGRVASLSIWVKNGTCSYRTKQNILKAIANKGGYLVISLRRNGKFRRNSVVHKLVAEAFIPKPLDYTEIDHIDGNPTNNDVKNLRWCTHSMNMLNPITRVRNSNARKNKKTANSIGVVQLECGVVIDCFLSIKDAYKETHISPHKIKQCLDDPNLSYKGFSFAYLSDYKTLINKSKNQSISMAF